MRFTKLSGAGNDFILLHGPGAAPTAEQVRRLCDRREGVGADGVLLVRRSAGRSPHSVVYLNADGSRAFCGNGTRCAAWWLRTQGAPRRMRLATEAGVVDAVVEAPGRVRVRMPKPAKVRLGLELEAAGRRWLVHAAEVGVPHAVVEVERLDRFPVREVGPAIRRHPAFGKAGANANFVERLGPSFFAIRTFERGVEDETLACGSGATASALILEAIGRAAMPLRLRVKGGDTLVVSREGGGLWLEGPARITFTGVTAL